VAGDGLDEERLRREVIAAAVRRRADELGGYLRWTELTNFALPDGTTVRLVDPAGAASGTPRTLSPR
jgi:putative restriction endonuclease